MERALTFSCTKLDAEGRVFLNNSSASSSFKVLIVKQCCLGVIKVFLHIDKLDSQLTYSLSFHLDGTSCHLLLLRLRSHQLVVVFDGSLLRSSRLSQASAHLIAHLLQNAYNFTTLWRVLGVVLCHEERHDLLAVTVLHVDATLHHVAQNGSSLGLQKGTSHATLQRFDGFFDRHDVGAGITLFLGVGSSFLFPQPGCLGQGK